MSDVFDEYCRIMEAKGHIKKEAQDASDTSVSKSKSVTRVDKEKDKDYRDTIMALYGLDIELNDSKKSIVEQAHPDMVVVSPAYDRMNGVVENIQERQNVMIGITRKPANGNLTQHRYAKKELLDELVRLGFDLDNQNQEGLAKEATVLAIEFSKDSSKISKSKRKCEKHLKKEAIALLPILLNPWLWRGVTGVTAWGAIKKNVVGYINQGLASDVKRAIEALRSFEEVVAGPDKATVNRYVLGFEAFLQESEKALDILARSEVEEIGSLSTSEDIFNVKSQIKGSASEKALVEKFIRMTGYIAHNIDDKILPKLRNTTAVTSEVESEWWQMAKSIWYATSVTGESTPKDNAINAVAAVRNSALYLVEKYKDELVETTAKAKESIKQRRQQALSELTGSRDSREAREAPPSAPEELGGYIRSE